MQFRFEQVVNLPQNVLFAFHENPEHITLLHHGSTKVRLISHNGAVRVGCRTWVEVNVLGVLPVVLGFQHTIYEPPRRFGEDLIHGPFSRFFHIHEFEETAAGTIVRDLLEVELPWYYGGEAAMQRVIAPSLRRAFGFRAAALQKLAQSGVITQYVEQR